MNRWGRIVMALASLATAAWIGAGALGYDVVDGGTLARHTLLAFSALLALVLCHAWIAVYLLVAERLVRAANAAAAAALARSRRLGVAAAALAVTATIAQFTSANALYPARLDARWHALAALATVVVLVLALALERSALAAAGRSAATAAD